MGTQYDFLKRKWMETNNRTASVRVFKSNNYKPKEKNRYKSSKDFSLSISRRLFNKKTFINFFKQR